MRIALLNCAPLPEPDTDEAPLLVALEAAGHEAECIAWNRVEPLELAGFHATLLRATWDYYEHLDSFLAWLARAAQHTTLLNPLEVVRANAHKGYLLDLKTRGIPTVPTEIIKQGDTAAVAERAAALGWADLVIKPAVGAGSFLTLRAAADSEQAQTHLDQILASRDAMLQPFVPSVTTTGERSICCYRGVPHHAIHKAPRFKDDDESVSLAELTPELEAFAGEVLEAAEATGLLYARVDCFQAEDGTPILSELELIEPSLFFSYAERAAENFVTHLEHHLELAIGLKTS